MKQKRSFVLFFIIFICTQSFAGAEETLTWKDCVIEARKNHPDLVSAQEKLNQSKASKMQTQSALLPQVSGSVDAGRSSSPSSSTFSTSKKSDSYSYGVNGKQLLFDGFKTYFDVEQAAKNIDASRYSYEVTSSNVRLRLRMAFVDLLKAQKLLSLAENIAKRRKQSEELITLRYNADREHKGSLLTTQANLAQAEFDIEQARHGIALAQRELSKELGRGTLKFIKAEGDFQVKGQGFPKPDFESLSATTPFLQQLAIQKEAGETGSFLRLKIRGHNFRTLWASWR